MSLTFFFYEVKERTDKFHWNGDDSVLNRKRWHKKVAVAMLSLRLGFQKLLDIFDALLSCHSHDVVQGIHVAQHLHNLFQQLPESTQKKTS